MTKRRGKTKKHQPNPPREIRRPPENIYRIKSSKTYSTYSYSSYKPEEVGTFFTDLERNVHQCGSDSFPQFMCDVGLPIDLNEGMEQYYEEKEVDSNRSSKSPLPLWQKFLKWIMLSDFDLTTVDFVARRGILKYIGYTLYDYYKSPWTFNVCKYQGKVYMYEPCPEQRSQSSMAKDSRCRKYLYWGKKFENSVTSSKEDMSGCYRMVRSNIGKYKILLGAEVDAVRLDGADDVVIEKVLQGCPDCPLINSFSSSDNVIEFIEIKTCVKRQVRNKTSYGWLQSYLAGVDTLVFGFRDNEGMVGSIEEYKVRDVPLTAEWDASAMFGLISGVLNWLCQQVEEGCSGTLQYRGAEKHDIEFTKQSEGHFLPDWFTKHLQVGEGDRMKLFD